MIQAIDSVLTKATVIEIINSGISSIGKILAYDLTQGVKTPVNAELLNLSNRVDQALNCWNPRRHHNDQPSAAPEFRAFIGLASCDVQIEDELAAIEGHVSRLRIGPPSTFIGKRCRCSSLLTTIGRSSTSSFHSDAPEKLAAQVTRACFRRIRSRIRQQESA